MRPYCTLNYDIHGGNCVRIVVYLLYLRIIVYLWSSCLFKVCNIYDCFSRFTIMNHDSKQNNTHIFGTLRVNIKYRYQRIIITLHSNQIVLCNAGHM